MSKKTSSQCYLCGKVANTVSRDHIPPKNIAPKSSNALFQYAPACTECNQKFSHEESKFRDFLAILRSGSGIVAADDAYAALSRSLARNADQRAGMPHKDLLRIMEGIGEREIYTPNGIYVGTARVISPASDINIPSLLIKVARGLHYVHCQTIIPNDYSMEGHTIRRIPEIVSELPIVGGAGDFFHYRGCRVDVNPQAGIWFMAFYQAVFGMVYFDDPLRKNHKLH